ncbi:hypothetical protein L7F22_037559 [Adiantum nelumboides]|nr:hypothetical protein [Adiantum nelumboides]
MGFTFNHNAFKHIWTRLDRWYLFHASQFDEFVAKLWLDRSLLLSDHYPLWLGLFFDMPTDELVHLPSRLLILNNSYLKNALFKEMALHALLPLYHQALRKSEEMLVEDTAQFEAFLKQNDEKVLYIFSPDTFGVSHPALMQRFQEQLDECKKYKDFILSLTPKDWLDATSKTAVESTKRKSETVETGDVGSGGEIAVIDNGGEEVDANTLEKMYFQSPNQLLEIFRELEEKNLLLMQESQDVETSLENLKAKFNDTKVNNESKIASLQLQLQAIKAAIKTEEERQSNLQTKTNVNMIDKTYDVSFDEIATKVSEVYVRCGLEDDPALGTLQKLTSIEAKLEESISALVGVPPEFIEQTEKSREKQRRLALREEKMEKQRMEQEKRAERSLERAHVS